VKIVADLWAALDEFALIAGDLSRTCRCTNPAPRQGWKRWLPQLSYNWLALLRWLLIVLGWILAIVLAGVIGSLFKS
jgi:hypothetical protein